MKSENEVGIQFEGNSILKQNSIFCIFEQNLMNLDLDLPWLAGASLQGRVSECVDP